MVKVTTIAVLVKEVERSIIFEVLQIVDEDYGAATRYRLCNEKLRQEFQSCIILRVATKFSFVKILFTIRFASHYHLRGAGINILTV